MNPNGSKNPSGSLAPICWEGWNDACAAKTTVLAHVKDLWKQIYGPNVPKIHIDVTLLSVLKISALRLRACAADTTHCKTNLTVSLEDLNFCHQTKTEDSAENDPF